VNRRKEKQNAAALRRKLSPFVPDRVIYIERGGRALGIALAAGFNVPSFGIDIGYPLSRLPHPLLYAAVFPIKEICYRLTRPRLVSRPRFLGDKQLRTENILLVDDTASSGKSLEIASKLLREAGVSPRNLRVVVARRGRRADALVDVSL
jgi:hypoxanthine phosphoribosyltransferase